MHDSAHINDWWKVFANRESKKELSWKKGRGLWYGMVWYLVIGTHQS